MALMIGALTIHASPPGPQVMHSNVRPVLGQVAEHVDRQPHAGSSSTLPLSWHLGAVF